MIIESILNEMEQRKGEKTHYFLVRQHEALKLIRQMNALEVRLGQLMLDEEPTGKMGSSLKA